MVAMGSKPLTLCYWMSTVAALALLGSSCTADLLPIYWNSTNPMFRIDNADHVMKARLNDIIEIHCPFYNSSDVDEELTEQLLIYRVSRFGYENCVVDEASEVFGACRQPFLETVLRRVLRLFSPLPNGLEFIPGMDYYFISANASQSNMSASKDERQDNGILCRQHNMRMKLQIEEKKHQKTLARQRHKLVIPPASHPMAPLIVLPQSSTSSHRPTTRRTNKPLSRFPMTVVVEKPPTSLDLSPRWRHKLRPNRVGNSPEVPSDAFMERLRKDRQRKVEAAYSVNGVPRYTFSGDDVVASDHDSRRREFIMQRHRFISRRNNKYIVPQNDEASGNKANEIYYTIHYADSEESSLPYKGGSAATGVASRLLLAVALLTSSSVLLRYCR